jgi:uroporphyrin-3 C-methyltransferase
VSDFPRNATEPGAAPAAAQPAAAERVRVRSLLPALALVLFAAALLWQWYDSRTELGALRQELAKRLAEADARHREARQLAGEVREALADAQAKLAALESRLAESQNQQIALEALYQELSRNRDEWAYAEIEQSLLSASQQLALAGNVRAALIALQAAEARLQRMNRPQLLALRRALARDIERLKAAPQVDAVAIGARLEALAALVETLPLAMEARPPAAPVPAAGAAENAWARFWREVWGELKQLVRVQQMDQPDVALLAPAQAYFLRENLKLRLLGARLALAARDGAAYQADLKAAREWIGRYYDTRHPGVVQALAQLRNLQEAKVGLDPPDISATLEAMRNLRLARERGGR